MSLKRRLAAKRNGYEAGFLLMLVLLYPELSNATSIRCQNPFEKCPAASSTRASEPSSSVRQWPESVSALPASLASIWITTAAALSPESHQPFSTIAPLSWLFHQRLQADIKARIREWSTGCVIPARQRLLESASEIQYADLMPLPGTRLHAVMSDMALQIDGSEQNCGAFIHTLISLARFDLANQAEPKGEGWVEGWASELGLSSDEAVTFFIMRE